MRRRSLLLAGASAAAGCSRFEAGPALEGGWVGADAQRGHRLRELRSGNLPPPAVQRSAAVLIVGAGIAGLAAARRLAAAQVDDVHLLELEDEAGGNSRGHRIAGLDCPLGAHYLPTPGDAAVEVAELLEDFGLRRIEHGRPVYDERTLCHSPQERLFIDGQWQDGLLPGAHDDAALLAQYRRFAQAVEATGRAIAFAMPTARAGWSDAHAALDRQGFGAWLDTRGLVHPELRWYLDYCCRDDYGAPAAQVSAWAGLHYFASRHGFHVPGDDSDGDEHDGVLAWPEGNAWLARRLAAPWRGRLHLGRVALRASETRHGVQVDAWDAQAGRVERWSVRQLVLAVPLFVALRLLDAPSPALAPAVAPMAHAPWLVANLHLHAALTDRPGAPMSWDNVLYDEPGGGDSLGYVDATHQSLRPVAEPLLLTAYRALAGRGADALNLQRRRLLEAPWQDWAGVVIDDLSRAHPDLRRKLARIDLMRYGHAMSIPLPGVRGQPALRALAEPSGRVHFAHSDLSAYSVFEEAFFHGHRAGGDVAAALRA